MTAFSWDNEDGSSRIGPGWRVTHEPTGYSIMGALGDHEIDPDDYSTLIAYAKHMAKVLDWSEVTPEGLAKDHAARARCVAAAEAFIATRDRGEG